MNGFEEVEKLKELEQDATPEKWQLHEGQHPGTWEIMAEGKTCQEFDITFEDSDIADPKLITDLRNAAPLLLDIAGQIQPGDDKLLAQLVYEQEDLARFMTGFGGIRQSERVMIDLLKRYQKMAERMHENRAISFIYRRNIRSRYMHGRRSLLNMIQLWIDQKT